MQDGMRHRHVRLWESCEGESDSGASGRLGEIDGEIDGYDDSKDRGVYFCSLPYQSLLLLLRGNTPS